MIYHLFYAIIFMYISRWSWQRPSYLHYRWNKNVVIPKDFYCGWL